MTKTKSKDPAPQNLRLVCFDLDGTLIDKTVYIWSTLHQHFGSDPARRQQASDDFHAGRISYRQWFETDLELLRERGANRSGILEALSQLKPVCGAHETLQILKQRGYRLGIISGSLDIVIETFFADVFFDHVLINKLRFDQAGGIAGGDPTPFDMDHKADGLAEVARREGISLSQCAFVGDNVNDLSVMKVAGFSIGVFIKDPKVAQVADVVLRLKDLRDILPLFPLK
jgi:phosphoserine phosphatase